MDEENLLNMADNLFQYDSAQSLLSLVLCGKKYQTAIINIKTHRREQEFAEIIYSIKDAQ